MVRVRIGVVMVSGGAVIISMTGLFIMGGATFNSLAAGSIVVVAVAAPVAVEAAPDAPAPDFKQPAWDGGPVEGKRIASDRLSAVFGRGSPTMNVSHEAYERWRRHPARPGRRPGSCCLSAAGLWPGRST